MLRLLRKHSTFKPLTGKTLVAQDSLLSDPICIVFGNQGHAQRISNLTGAITVVPHKDDDVLGLISTYKNCKIGAVSFENGNALNIAGELMMQGKHLNAVASFNGLPANVNLERLPLHTPVQCHFSKSLHDNVAHLEKLWIDSINAGGGIHSKGFHSLEENMFFYDAPLDFMEQHSHHSDQAWSRLFLFLIEHLKEI